MLIQLHGLKFALEAGVICVTESDNHTENAEAQEYIMQNTIPQKRNSFTMGEVNQVDLNWNQSQNRTPRKRGRVSRTLDRLVNTKNDQLDVDQSPHYILG